MSFKNTKVLMLYDNNDEYVYKCCTNIIIELNKKIYNKYNIKIYKNCNIKNVDIVIVFSNEIKTLNKIFNLYKYKKYRTPMYIVTNNLNTNNIVNAVNLTSYISYMKNSSERIVKKALEILNGKRKLHY